MKTTKQQTLLLKRKCDKVFSEYIRRGGKCDWCGKQDGKLDCAHIISRRNMTLRWDVINAVPLCFTCHRRWHDNPLLGAAWFNTKYPNKEGYLMFKKNEITKRGIQDYRDLYEELKNL